uniref:Uncharacterized protein n=1 Tax=Panagrolaimus davidi TaxID=227884 RepID=A0A914NZB3_9BILA
MTNENNCCGGRQLGEDDARALFNALDPALRNLLIQEGRRSDSPQEPPYDDWDIQPLPSTSRGSFQASATRAPFQASSTRGNFQSSSARAPFYLSSSRATFEHGYCAPLSNSRDNDYMADDVERAQRSSLKKMEGEIRTY